jgi:hypothetical protein
MEINHLENLFRYKDNINMGFKENIWDCGDWIVGTGL